MRSCRVGAFGLMDHQKATFPMTVCSLVFDTRRSAGIAMLDRTDLEPLFFAPFVSSVMRVEQGWIDYNGHLNMAYYNVLFDRCVDEAYELLGIGLDYLKTQRHSTFTAEAHVRYLRELHDGVPVRATLQLPQLHTKRIHYFHR